MRTITAHANCDDSADTTEGIDQNSTTDPDHPSGILNNSANGLGKRSKPYTLNSAKSTTSIRPVTPRLGKWLGLWPGTPNALVQPRSFHATHPAPSGFTPVDRRFDNYTRGTVLSKLRLRPDRPPPLSACNSFRLPVSVSFPSSSLSTVLNSHPTVALLTSDRMPTL